MSKPSMLLARLLAPLRHLGHDDVADVVGVAEPQHRAVGDLARELEHVRRQGAEVDRQLVAGLVAHELEFRVEVLAHRAARCRAGSRERSATYSRIWVTGLVIVESNQFSTVTWCETPSPRTMRPPDSSSIVAAVCGGRHRRPREDRQHPRAEAGCRSSSPRRRRGPSASRGRRCGSCTRSRSRARRRARARDRALKRLARRDEGSDAGHGRVYIRLCPRRLVRFVGGVGRRP